MEKSPSAFYSRYLPRALFAATTFEVQTQHAVLTVRPRTWNLAIVAEVFLDQCYLPTLIDPDTKMNTIIDLGGNIGTFSVWAAQKYQPKVLVTAEPDPDNLYILQKNLEQNGLKPPGSSTTKVHLIQKAVYKKTGKIGFVQESLNKGRNAVDEHATVNLVPTITLKDLFTEQKLDTVDFMKIDIEGGEQFILTPENAQLFTDKVKYVFMETHTRLGAHKEDGEKYFKNLGFKCKYSESWSNPGAGALEVVNPKFHK